MKLGVKRENIWLVDLDGVVYEGRKGDDTAEGRLCPEDRARTLDEVIADADLFLGLSGPGVLTPDMVAKMAKRPIIFALANPTPEIMPDESAKSHPRRSSPPDAAIFPIKSTMSCVFPLSFAAPSTLARRKSTTR